MRQRKQKLRGKQRERKRQRQAEGDQNRCSHILSAARIARETQEPPPKNQTSKAQKKGNVNIISETLRKYQAQLFQIKDLNKQELLTAVFPEILHDTRLIEPP